MWKFHDFTVTQMLSEINDWESIIAKSAVLTHLEAKHFSSYEFLHFLKIENYQNNKMLSPKNGKNGSFRTSRFSKINFT